MKQSLALVMLVFCCAPAPAQQKPKFDEVTLDQAALEKKLLERGESRTQTPAMEEYRKTVKVVEYPSGPYKLPGYLFVPKGAGPFPCVIWLHGSEKEPKTQAELARF